MSVRIRFNRPHGSTHPRAVAQFDTKEVLDGFDDLTEQLLSTIESETVLRRPVTAVIDVTTISCYGGVNGTPMVSETSNAEGRAFEFAALSDRRPESPSYWLSNRFGGVLRGTRIHPIDSSCRPLVRRAKRHIPIGTVLCDREFDPMDVFKTLSNLGTNYPILERIIRTEREAIATMEDDGQDLVAESASVHVEAGSHHAVSVRSGDEWRRHRGVRDQRYCRPGRSRSVLPTLRRPVADRKRVHVDKHDSLARISLKE